MLLWSAYGPTLELYDRSRDPALLRNVAAWHPERTGRMRPELDTVIELCGLLPAYDIEIRPVLDMP